MKAGEDIARCPSCSLIIRVIYDEGDFEESSDDEEEDEDEESADEKEAEKGGKVEDIVEKEEPDDELKEKDADGTKKENPETSDD